MPADLADVNHWVETYGRGEYLPYPASLAPARVAPQLADAAAIMMATVDIIRKTWPNRDAMIREHQARRDKVDPEAGFSPRPIAQRETDYWLRTLLTLLARFPSMDEASRDAYGQELAKRLGRYPRRKLGIIAVMPVLERVLSSPLWRE